MSNRTDKQVSAMASLRAAHLVQIEALSAPGLNKHERIWAFAKAAGFKPRDIDDVMRVSSWSSAAYAVWIKGGPQRSIFAYFPKTCLCPVQAYSPGVPVSVPNRWQPTAGELEVFSRIQIEKRFPE